MQSEVVEPGVDDRAAERLEPPHVERDVVVHDEVADPAGWSRVLQMLRQDPLKGVGVEIGLR